MTNIATILKSEISRVARKELRVEALPLKKAAATQRKEIAALKRRILSLEQALRLNRERQKTPAVAIDETTLEGRRFSAKGLRSQRRRLGISAEECGLLVGASAQSVYNWEQGKTRPSAKHWPAVAALNSLGKKEASAVLATRSA